MRLAFAAILVCAGCSTLQQDPPTETDGGGGLTVALIQNPKSPDYHPCPAANPTCDTQTASDTVVTWLDTYDETADGKSVGTLYIRDQGVPHVYGGIGVYEPDFVPADLDPLPGDVIDFAGPYQEATSIGSATFNAGTFLPQLYKPVGTFRYEFASDFPASWSAPLTLQLSDLNEHAPPKTDGNFAHARQYMQMLVTVNDVDIGPGSSVAAGSGARVTYPMYPHGGSYVQSVLPAEISNELFPLLSTDYPSGTHFKSVTGIVTWFYSFHIAPRSRDDLVLASGDAGSE